MKHRTIYMCWPGALVAAITVACIIPDKDIVVIVDDCGEEWIAHTAGAFGYNGLEEKDYIETEDGEWIAKTYCVTPAQGEELLDLDSDLANELLTDIVSIC